MSTILLTAWVMATPAPSGAAQKDRAALQGTWRVVSVEAGGKKMPENTYRDTTVTIAGDRITFRTKNGYQNEAIYKLDPAGEPKAIDLTFVSGRHKGKTQRGIYEIEGDTFRLCTDSPGGKRPAEFATRPDTALGLLVLQRVKE